MDRESVERLRFDRRLQQRRGWVEVSDYSAHVEALPDVAAKMTTAAELEAEKAETAAVPTPTPPPVHAAAPPVAERPSLIGGTSARVGLAGDFSSSLSSTRLAGSRSGLSDDSEGTTES